MVKFTCDSTIEKYQFSFKIGYSTSLCTSRLELYADYITKIETVTFYMFYWFLEKKFDTVDYWNLFSILLDDGLYKKFSEL